MQVQIGHIPPEGRRLSSLGGAALAAFALAIGLALSGAPRAAAAHAAFALGAMPLIFAAMGHFVPVLTRTGGAPSALGRLPRAMQAAGALVVGALAGVLPGAALHGAALIGLAGAGCLAVWVRQRGRRTLGRPHPGVAWYAAALGCLMLALLAILAGLVWPAAYPALRLAHLHLNTLGFIGLSALGTLQVLMPTVLGVQDPDAVQRLRGQLPWALTAVALAALAGVMPVMAALGGVLFGGLVAMTLIAWARAWGVGVLRDGAAASLLAATLGLLGLIGHGIAHGVGYGEGGRAVAGFFALFLAPLVTGALSQLLPVWRHSGATGPARTALRARLAAGGGARALLFLTGGALQLAGEAAGAAFVAVGLGLFGAALLRGTCGFRRDVSGRG
ncbi:MAG TPA: hypothetical protein PKD33_11150 [Rhodocyclaceae bacterium]|nr:hypothetical protein [Rhodocyclaceae bacterium]